MQNLLNAKGRDPAGILNLQHVRKPADGAFAEMTIVIVRNHDGINVRQFLQRQRCREETPGSSLLRRGRALIPDRIDEQPCRVEFSQRGGVTHPGDAGRIGDSPRRSADRFGRDQVNVLVIVSEPPKRNGDRS